MAEPAKIRDISSGESGWCALEALYSILDAEGDVVFLLRGDHELKKDVADLGPEGVSAWLRVSKDLKEDTVSGINPQTRERISLGGLVVDADELSGERRMRNWPCFPEDRRREGDVTVDSLRGELGELVWAG